MFGPFLLLIILTGRQRRLRQRGDRRDLRQREPAENAARRGSAAASRLLALTEQPSRFFVHHPGGHHAGRPAEQRLCRRELRRPRDQRPAGRRRAIPENILRTISLLLITVVLAYFNLIFGELVPKRIAMQRPMEMARLSCRLVSALSVIARPVVSLLSLSTNGVLRLLGMRTDVEEEQVTEDEIRMMIDLGQRKRCY